MELLAVKMLHFCLALCLLLLLTPTYINGDGSGEGGDLMSDISSSTVLMPVATSETAPTPTPVEATKTSEEEAEGLSAGAVAGITVGTIVGVAAIAGVGVLVTVLILKFAKPGGKVSPMKKGDAGREQVHVEKQSLVDSLAKPE